MREIFLERAIEIGIPGWLIPDYAIMLTAAIISACLITLVLSRGARETIPVSSLLFYGIIGLFIGSKVLYSMQYGFHWDRFFQARGFALYGGLVGLVSAWLLYYLLRPYPLWKFLDYVTPGLGFGLFLGRIGCFLAGCNGGLACGLPWAVRFPAGTSSYDQQLVSNLISEEAELSLPAHPTQLYESFFGLVAFVLLLIILRRKSWDGEVFLSGMIWYAIFRFPSEWLRADGGGLQPLGFLTFSQFVSLLLLICSVFLYRRLSRVPKPN